MFEKWQQLFDGDSQSLLWLWTNSDSSLVWTLWCDVCRECKGKIAGMRNFAILAQQITRLNIFDHARSEQHVTSMACMRTAHAKASNEPVDVVDNG